MVNKICCLLAMVLSAPAGALCLDKMLTPKERKGSRAEQMIFWTGSYILIAVAKIILSSSVGVLAAGAVYIIGTIVILKRCYQEPMLEKAIAWVTLVGFTVLGDGISTVIYCLICSERLARIRHDYRNVLNAALILMEGGNHQKAKELLLELTEKVNATSESPFCTIPVINAVLTEKKTMCGEQGILLRPELLLPEILPVDDFDLCIILGNLIDNAIRACSGKTDYNPEIVLSAGVVQGYLVIRCENPVLSDTEEKKGAGYGQKILKNLAEKYHGNFLTQKQDGRYTAQITLFLEKKKAGETEGETGKRGNSVNMLS